MGEQKKLIKNIALFLLVGAIPLVAWASGFLEAFSWASGFLLLGGVLCLLWLRERHTNQALKRVLMTCGDGWAVYEGNQLLDCSPAFPVTDLQAFKDFFHLDASLDIERAIARLMHDRCSFQITVRSAEGNDAFIFEGVSFEDKLIFWLRNITSIKEKERIYKESLKEKNNIIANLQEILDLFPLPVWQRDKHQKIINCNSAYAVATGSSIPHIIRDGIELMESRFSKILARKAVNMNELQLFETTAIIEEDRCRLRICEIPNPRTQGTLGIGFDITELDDARREFNDLVDAHNEVLAHLSTAIAIYGADGSLQYYNQAYITLNNFDEEFLKTRPHLDEVLEDLRSRRQLPESTDFPNYKKKCLERLTSQIESIEELMHLPDERTLRYFSAPHPMGGLLCIFEDVTNYLSLERNNKTILNSYQTTLDNLFEGVVVFGSDNRLELFNPSFLRLWNFQQDDVSIGQHLTLVVEKLKDFFDYGDDWETYKAQFIESVTDRIPKSSQLKLKDGVTLCFGYVPLPNGSHLLSYVDTTDTCRVQQALQERNEALETADRLKSEFIENVSLELKMPLNTIVGFSEVLYNQYFGKLNKKQIEYVEGILDSSTKLLHLISDILDLASIEAGYVTLEPSVVNLPQLLKNVIKIVSKRLEKNKQRILLKGENVVDEWVADELRLKQVLVNLLSNAINCTPPQGNITIEASLIDDELVISVSDAGLETVVEGDVCRLDESEGEDGEKKNTLGIGLSLVKNLMELHGGRIELSSEIGQGTIVSCFLPRMVLDAEVEQISAYRLKLLV